MKTIFSPPALASATFRKCDSGTKCVGRGSGNSATATTSFKSAASGYPVSARPAATDAADDRSTSRKGATNAARAIRVRKTEGQPVAAQSFNV